MQKMPANRPYSPRRNASQPCTTTNVGATPFAPFYIFRRMNMFDYISFANSMSINSDVVKFFEQEAKDEFPNDIMLRELHVMRALKAYSSKNLYLAV